MTAGTHVHYLLDTNAISDIVTLNPRVAAKLAALDPADRVFITTMIEGEVLYGIENMPVGAKRKNLEAEVAKAFAKVENETVPRAAAGRYAAVKAACVRSGVALGENDLWIAATAMVLGATLVTRDRDFTRVAGLTTEDWTQ